eukprot:jgi/Mesvir1/5040/Mv02244-RA.1
MTELGAMRMAEAGRLLDLCEKNEIAKQIAEVPALSPSSAMASAPAVATSGVLLMVDGEGTGVGTGEKEGGCQGEGQGKGEKEGEGQGEGKVGDEEQNEGEDKGKPHEVGGEGDLRASVDSGTSVYSADGVSLTPITLLPDEDTPVVLDKKLATAAYGILYKGRYGSRDVTIKVISKEVPPEEMPLFRAEVALMQKRKHRNLLEFIGAKIKPPRVLLLSEYISGGSIHDRLHKHHKQISTPLLLQIALDTARGMAYMHNNNILHCSLKTGNLLLTENKLTKIADFGFIRLLSGEEGTSADVGAWTAPEVLKRKPPTLTSDVYSFGMVLWEMLAGAQPYANMPLSEAVVAVARRGMRPPIPPKAPKCLADIVQACWQQEPDKRPEFTAVLKMLEKARLELLPVPEGITPQMIPLQVDDVYRAELLRPSSAKGWLKNFNRDRRPSDAATVPEGKPAVNIPRHSLDEQRLSVGHRHPSYGPSGHSHSGHFSLTTVPQENGLETSQIANQKGEVGQPQDGDKHKVDADEPMPPGCFCFGGKKATKASRLAK